MLKNYIKVALRSLGKQKVYSIINVTGLAISITACLLIVLYVKHELSYDTFFPNADRIYKLVLERKYPNHSTFFSVVPHSYAGVLQQDFPEVENNLHMLGPNQNTVVRYEADGEEPKSFEENFFFFADTSFFSFFDIPLIKGDKRTALQQPNQLIISQSAAIRYFGNDEPLGKVLKGNFGELKITGVFNDRSETYELAVRYQFYHAFALLAVGILQHYLVSGYLKTASIFFLAGTILFSGSLYLLCFSGSTAFAMVTPFGGVLLIFGWVFLAVGIFNSKK